MTEIPSPQPVDDPTDEQIDNLLHALPMQPWGIGSRIPDARAAIRAALAAFRAPAVGDELTQSEIQELWRPYAGAAPFAFARKIEAAIAARCAPAQARAPAHAGGWQPAETCESGGATILVKNDRGQVCPMSRGVIHNNPGSANNDWDYGSTITGWMHLPAADSAPATAVGDAAP